jgi:Berberine and berberine like
VTQYTDVHHIGDDREGSRDIMFAGGFTPAPELVAPEEGQVKGIEEALAPWAAPHMYLNLAETRRDPATLWTDEAYHRLRRIKAAVDPGDLILSNQPVPPMCSLQ